MEAPNDMTEAMLKKAEVSSSSKIGLEGSTERKEIN